MSGKPIRVSPYSHDPFAHLTMTDEELEELYSNRDSDFSRPYTVTDVITRVYNRNFRDDFVSSFESDPSLFNTLAKNGESMEIVKYWINEFSQNGIEAVYSLTDHKCPVDVVYKVRIKAQVRVLQHAETLQYCNISATVRLRYLFDFMPCCLTCDYLGVILDEKMSVCGMNPEAIRLDKYLLPLLMKDKDYEKFSQDIIKKYLPEYLNSAEPISGMEWLHNMGLKIHYGRFPDRSIMGEYFIRCGTALIYDIECSKFIKGYLNPGAIVINEESCETEGMVNTTCTHEGVHHCGGWFFFMLQMCHGKNTTSYVCKRYNLNNHGKWSPIDILELHANKLPGYILIQTKPGKKKAKEFLASYGNMKPLEKTRRLVDDMASYFNVTKTMAARRLSDFGYKDVRGMTQYVDGRKIPSYISNLPDNKTYSIDENEALNEYLSNPKFRSLIDTGLFEYIEGHYCLKHEKYIYRDQFGNKRMTYYAREHMADCCLVFEIKYSGSGVVSFAGILHKGNSIPKSKIYDDSGNNPLVTKEGKELREKIERMRSERNKTIPNFNEMTRRLMSEHGFTVETLSEATGVSVGTIKNMRSNSEKAIKIESIVAVCIAMHLDYKVSEEYIRKAPSSFLGTIDMDFYQFALIHWSNMTVAQVNRKLLESEIIPLTGLIAFESEEEEKLYREQQA